LEKQYSQSLKSAKLFFVSIVLEYKFADNKSLNI
jgi:hypothetical protein